MKQAKFSLKSVLFGALLVYVGITLTILWMLEVNLLPGLYRSTKIASIKSQAKYIQENINSDNITEILNDVSDKNESYIVLADENGSIKYSPDMVFGNVFRIPKEVMEKYLKSLEASSDEKIIEIDRDNFKSNIYKIDDKASALNTNRNEIKNLLGNNKENAEENNKAANENNQIDMSILPGDGNQIFENNLQMHRISVSEQAFSPLMQADLINMSVTKEARYNSILYTKSLVTSDGEKLILVITTNIVPVDSTINTIKLVLVYVSIIMILLAIILALIFSNTLTSSLVKITETAKEFSKGNYNVKFEPNKYKELNDLSDTLNYSAKELSKVDEIRREFIANVSHDLRTPLTMIIGYSEAIRDFPKEDVGENIQVVIDEAKRLTTLVNDVLDMTKIESGFMELKNDKFNITKNIEDMVNRYTHMLENKDYKFKFEHKDKEVYVYADELRISQVIYNLVNNAITHCGPDKEIIIRQTVIGKKVKIEVIDHGEGIPKEKIKDIWNRYYKIDKEHKRDQVGTGIGLSIIKQILVNYNSEYGVETEVGKGSDFYFTLDTISKSQRI